MWVFDGCYPCRIRPSAAHSSTIQRQCHGHGHQANIFFKKSLRRPYTAAKNLNPLAPLGIVYYLLSSLTVGLQVFYFFFVSLYIRNRVFFMFIVVGLHDRTSVRCGNPFLPPNTHIFRDRNLNLPLTSSATFVHLEYCAN